MNTNKNAVPISVVPNSHAEAAQARIDELRRTREQIPHFVIPASMKEAMRLHSAASLSAQFVELTIVAVANEAALVRGGAATPAEVRDLLSYADAYGPLADQYEAMAQFIRHSVAAARNKAGSEALTTYALAQRLARRPEHAALAPYVADMRRALGRGRKPSPETLARRAEAQAVKAEAKAAKAAAKAAKWAPPASTPATQKS